MFNRKKKEEENWCVDLNVEGSLQAMALSRNEGLPGVNQEYNNYPVNVEIVKRTTLQDAVNKAIEFGKAGIYSIIYRNKREDKIE